MKILIYSSVFYPSIGGMETTSLILAEQFHKAGNQVTLITTTPGDSLIDHKMFPYLVLRNPPFRKIYNLVKDCDIFFHKGVSLKAFWPIVFFRNKFAVVHETWYKSGSGGKRTWQDKLKLWISRYVVNISISEAVAAFLPVKSEVILNPYQSNIFTYNQQSSRTKELIFVGRLVSDKGADILIEALLNLRQKGLTPQLSIVGDGPEKTSLQEKIASAQLDNQVKFLGIKKGQDLVKVLHEHQILVIPSRWAEPFGIVALEGISCGCVIAGSQQGGLIEAIGPCGLTFPNGDVQALSDVLYKLLNNKQLITNYRDQGPKHLIKFNERNVAERYLEVFQKLLVSKI